jgi:MFS family permease
MSQIGFVPAEVERRMKRRAILAATVGTAIEWYDFFLYTTVAALVLPKVFFPSKDQFASQLASFGTYFVGFAARPVGAAIFGHFGDRIGRKATLIATLLIMGVGTFLIGLMPTYAQIGVAAGIILTVLRALQGIGIGGEWGGSVLLSIEWNARGKRGLVGSWPQFGTPVGLALATSAFLIFNQVSGPHFLEWGWRVPFLLSVALVGVGLWIRLGVLDTPVFTDLAERQKLENAPVVEVWVVHWKEIILTSLARLGQNTQFYIFTGFILVYAAGTQATGLHFKRGDVLKWILWMSVVSLFTVPFFGRLSDSLGRKRVYLVGCLIMVPFAFLYYGLLDTRVMMLCALAVILSLPLHDMQYGPQAALIAESFTGRMRYSGSSLGFQLTSLVAGGPAPSVALALITWYHSSLPVAIYVAATGLIAAVATAFLRDNRARDITREYDEARTAIRRAAVPAGT